MNLLALYYVIMFVWNDFSLHMIGLHYLWVLLFGFYVWFVLDGFYCGVVGLCMLLALCVISCVL